MTRVIRMPLFYLSLPVKLQLRRGHLKKEMTAYPQDYIFSKGCWVIHLSERWRPSSHDSPPCVQKKGSTKKEKCQPHKQTTFHHPTNLGVKKKVQINPKTIWVQKVTPCEWVTYISWFFSGQHLVSKLIDIQITDHDNIICSIHSLSTRKKRTRYFMDEQSSVFKKNIYER